MILVCVDRTTLLDDEKPETVRCSSLLAFAYASRPMSLAGRGCEVLEQQV